MNENTPTDHIEAHVRINKAKRQGNGKLDLCYLDIQFLPSSLDGMASLKTLYLIGCGNLADIRQVSKLKALETLVLEGCVSLQDLSPLKSSARLKNLDIKHCEKVSDIAPLAWLTTLETLFMVGCGSIDIKHISELRNLSHVSFDLPDDISRLFVLGKLPSLNSVHIRGIGNV